jgi:hypothetical protein
MRYTKSTYEETAKIFGERIMQINNSSMGSSAKMLQLNVVKEIVVGFVKIYEKDNPKFNSRLFMLACGFTDAEILGCML